MEFIHHTIVRMYDTDTAQILFFGNQYRFMNDALEDLLASEGLTMDKLFRELPFGFVVVHSEANYLAPLHVGDPLKVSVTVSNIGHTSFEFSYSIYKKNKLAGNGKTNHVVINRSTQKKEPIPESLRILLKKYISD